MSNQTDYQIMDNANQNHDIDIDEGIGPWQMILGVFVIMLAVGLFVSAWILPINMSASIFFSLVASSALFFVGRAMFREYLEIR